MFAKAIASILLTCSVASADKAPTFHLKTKGNGVQAASEDQARKLYAQSRRLTRQTRKARSLRNSSGKGKGGGGDGAPQFIYEQDDDDSVLETINGDILAFDSPTDDEVALCTDTMCFGSVDAVLTGFTVDGVDFLAVNLSANNRFRDWEFLCPSALQTAAIVYQDCQCSGGQAGTCEFVLESDPVEGSNISTDVDTVGSCNEGVQGPLLISCTYIDPLPTIPPALLGGAGKGGKGKGSRK